jgi:hypothetical protein
MRYKRKKDFENGGINMKSLDMASLKKQKSIIMSSKEALKDVTPINWSKSVLSGEKKITVK